MADEDQLALVHQAPGLDGAAFDPLPVIRAVNSLWRLGEHKALRMLRAYTELAVEGGVALDGEAFDDQRVIVLARLLFEPPEGGVLPPPRVGVPDIYPRSPDDWPRFPLATKDDVPFLVVGGYSLGGLPEPAAAHLAVCAANAQFREGPLQPSRSPLEVVEALTRSPQWSALTAEDVSRAARIAMLRAQALRAVAEVYPLEGDYPAAAQSDESWALHLERTQALALRWDEERQRFLARGADTNSRL
ncbi:MAG: hypothetical protein ACRDTT_14210 [Pseudonocardiaceae bacterium]